MVDASEPKPLSYVGPPYPDRTFSVTYADGVMSIAFGNGHVKFHLHRLDPSFLGDSTSAITPFAQIVMPYGGFIATTVFFRRQMEVMLKSGAITQEMIDIAEAAWTRLKEPVS